MVVHGVAKIGKTSWAETAPGPRLFLDAEGGTEFLDKPTVMWDPMAAPPEVEGDVNVVVWAKDWGTVQATLAWLYAGNHPFNSLILDSLTEIQKKCKDAVAHDGNLDQQLWGQLLTKMELEMRRVRDLTKHPVKPLWAVVVLAHSAEKNGALRPDVQGALARSLAGFFDVIGHMRPGMSPTGQVARELVIDAVPGIEAGDRTKVLRRTFGDSIPLVLDDSTGAIHYSIGELIELINGGFNG